MLAHTLLAIAAAASASPMAVAVGGDVPIPGTQLQAAVNTAIAAGSPGLALVAGATYTFGNASFTMRGARAFALDGRGATLLFAPGEGVVVRESADAALLNITVAYDPPCFTQGTIVAHNATAYTYDVAIDAAYPAPNASALPHFGSSEVKLQFWDPTTRLRVSGQSPACVVNIVGATGAPGVWRVSGACGDVPATPVGILATLSPRIGATYDIPQFYRGSAWWIHGSTNVTSQDVTLTGSGNFAVLEWGGGGAHTYRRMTLDRVGSNLLSSNTDGFHSFSVGRGPHIVDSDFRFMSDDALNFHNRVAVVLAVVDGGASVQVVDLSDVPSPDGESVPAASALEDLVPGDNLKFMTTNRVPHGVDGMVVSSVSAVTDAATLAAARAVAAALPGVSVDPAAVTVWLVTLVGGVGSTGIAPGDIVQFDRRSCAGGLVENSTFSDAYDGVFRLQASNTTLRGNRWQRIAYKLQM